MNCQICGAQINRFVRYNFRHITIKSLIIKLLPIFNAIIPTSITKLKKLSHKNNKLFKGNIGICASCGHGEMSTPPTDQELKYFYQENYWSNFTNYTGRVEQDRYKTSLPAIAHSNYALKHLDLNSISSALEVGAGEAKQSLLFRDRLQNKNLSLYVCEAGSEWDKHYEHHKIIKVANYFPFDTQQTFDYIHSNHWLEHVLDLKEVISQLYNCLNPGGYVFVQVPNSNSTYWDVYFPDIPHIQFFTQDSLIKAFTKANFKCVTSTHCGPHLKTYLQVKSITEEEYRPAKDGMWVQAIFSRLN